MDYERLSHLQAIFLKTVLHLAKVILNVFSLCLCQSACWSPDGVCLLMSMQGERVIYVLTFSDLTGMSKHIR